VEYLELVQGSLLGRRMQLLIPYIVPITAIPRLGWQGVLLMVWFRSSGVEKVDFCDETTSGRHADLRIVFTGFSRDYPLVQQDKDKRSKTVNQLSLSLYQYPRELARFTKVWSDTRDEINVGLDDYSLTRIGTMSLLFLSLSRIRLSVVLNDSECL
jgi:hypothetical protein